ncbi:calcium-binding protein [Marinicella marina]|uniref:calcium-binding protein n=1 Tax=Marinicella marina TaxID=2996016 RepID=UPI0024BD4ECD|nr:calcium-binding protein [Marinicella marina]MDJ1139240.1 calcium-binding protein [Marinicella marina]
MNNLRWDLRKILKISALSGLTLGATMVSGYQLQPNQPLTNNHASQTSLVQTNTTNKASPIELFNDVVDSGALYVHKADAEIWFWLIQGENEAAQVKLHSILEVPDTIEPVRVNIIIEGISSVFYSDQLLANAADTDISYSVTGKFDRGRVVLPMAKGVYDPLFNVRQNEPKPLSEFRGLEALFAQQMDIYAQAERVKEQQVSQTEVFVSQTSQLLEDYTNAVLQLSEAGELLLTNNETEVLEVVNAGTTQIEQDLAAADETINEILVYLDKNKHNTAHYFNCIDQGGIQLENDLNEFELVADAYEEESDREDPLEDPLDDLSEAEEAHYDALQEEMHNCVGTEESIEQMANYLPTVNITETGDYQEVAAFEVRATGLMTEAESLGVLAYDKGMSFVDTATAIVNVDELASIEHAFDAWISPAYLEATSEGVDQLNKNSDQWLNRRKPTDADEIAQKLSETLCEDYTDFDIEFDVFGVGVVIGTPLDDSIKTGDEPNLVVTLQGDDCIETHDGVDFVFAGPDEDKIFGGDHHDFLIGGKGDDEIHGSAGKTYSWASGNVDIGNLILGAGGDDKLFGGEDDADKGEDGIVATEGFTDIILGDLWYTGEPGKDTIKGERGIDFIFGEQKDDTLSNAKTGAINLYGINFKLGSFFFAGDGNDNITGSDSTGAGLTQLLGDFVFGSQGNDTADGKGGFDFIFGGEGNDNLSGGKYFDLVFGNKDDDTVKGNDGADLVSGDTGNDKVYGNDGPFDLLLGGVGTDAMYGGNGVDLIFGSQDADRIEGNDGVDLIFAGDASDTVNGGNGVDLIFGSQGADFLYGNDGVDIIFGGDDADYISGGGSTDVIFGNENGEGSKRDRLYGDAGVDIIFGNRGEDYINGGADTDVLFGNSDNDEIIGGEGVDIMFGNTGDDNLSGEGGTDVAFGNSGNDTISGGGSTDVIFGNSGCDIISGDGSTDVLFGNSGADRIMGGDGTDVAFGNTGNDMIYGESGTDVLFGNSDNDYINNGSGTNITFGNSGNDHIIGGDNKDIIWGNSGNDYIAGGADKDFIWGNRGHDTIDGGSSGDIIFGNRDNDLINAGSGTDWIWGNRGNDRIRGLSGKNRIWGNRGDDTLDGYLAGGDTKDKLRGNRHSDTLTGNSSNSRDKLRGGWGSDTKMRNVTLLPANLFNEPTYAVDACLQ